MLGIAAGLLSGLLGIGGGLLLVGALILLLPAQGVPESIVVPVALASSLASIVLTGLSSAYAHHRREAVLWPSVLWLVPGMLLGAVVAGFGVVQWAGPGLRWVVAGYCVLVALQLFANWPRANTAATAKTPTGWPWSVAGLLIGAVSAVVGIGGGSMTVPALIWRGVPAVKAVATSAVCGVFIALAAALTYSQLHNPHPMPDYSLGYVYLPAALGVAVTSVLCAPLGARWAHQLPAPVLKKLFAAFLLLMALSLLWKS
ncbi:MAG: sulfite exporter TauE/SafE family protein [Arenimonas sp.]